MVATLFLLPVCNQSSDSTIIDCVCVCVCVCVSWLTRRRRSQCWMSSRGQGQGRESAHQVVRRNSLNHRSRCWTYSASCRPHSMNEPMRSFLDNDTRCTPRLGPNYISFDLLLDVMFCSSTILDTRFGCITDDHSPVLAVLRCSQGFLQSHPNPCFDIVLPSCSWSPRALFPGRLPSMISFSRQSAVFLTIWPKNRSFLATTDSTRFLSCNRYRNIKYIKRWNDIIISTDNDTMVKVVTSNDYH